MASQMLPSPLVNYSEVYDHMNIVKTWAVIHFEMLQKFKHNKFKKGIKFIASSDEYCRMFQSIIKFFVMDLNSGAPVSVE
jgi:hypothetical protein